MRRITFVVLTTAFLAGISSACDSSRDAGQGDDAPPFNLSRREATALAAGHVPTDTAYVGDRIHIRPAIGPASVMEYEGSGTYRLTDTGFVALHYAASTNKDGSVRRFAHGLVVLDTVTQPAARGAVINPTGNGAVSTPPQPASRLPARIPGPPARASHSPASVAQRVNGSVPPPPATIPLAIMSRVAPNQPAGFTVYTSRDFGSKASSPLDFAGSQGWEPYESKYARLTLIADESAPGTPPSVMRYTFPPGLKTGNGPASMMYKITDKSAGSLYVAIVVRFMPNFTHGTKIYYVDWTGGSYIIRVNSSGSIAGPLELSIRPNHSAFLKGFTNIGTGKALQRGQWHLLEFFMKLSSTPNARDGEVKVWFDGVLAASRTAWSLPGSPPFLDVKFSPIYGGKKGAPVPAEMNMDLDHVVVSGR